MDISFHLQNLLLVIRGIYKTEILMRMDGIDYMITINLFFYNVICGIYIIV